MKVPEGLFQGQGSLWDFHNDSLVADGYLRGS